MSCRSDFSFFRPAGLARSALALALFVAVCAPRTLKAQGKPGVPEPPAEGQTPAAIDSAVRYRLQPDDEIAIRVYRNPELDDTVKIGPDGRVSLLMFNDIVVTGMTVGDLQRALTERYGRLIVDPQVAVTVKTYANQKAFITGEVEHPGLVPIVGRATVLEAIAASGGFKNTAKPQHIYLVRKTPDNQPMTIVLNAPAMLKGSKPDVPLESFDVVYVPKSKIAQLDKVIDQYIRQLIPTNLNAGFTYLSSPSSAVIRFQ